MSDGLSILSWNVGFSRHGKLPISPLNFARSLFALGKNENSVRCREMADVLRGLDCDLYSLQEVCSSSILNSWTPVRKIFSHALPHHREFFLEDFRACILRNQCIASHGQSLYSRFPLHHESNLGLDQVWSINPVHRLKRASAKLVRLSLPGSGQQVTVISVHLAAVEDLRGTKRNQFRKIMEAASSEFANGREVIVCGDFNYEILCGPDGPNTRSNKTGVTPFPRGDLPDGWVLSPGSGFLKNAEAADEFTTELGSIVDGFIVSPNLSFERVEIVKGSLLLSDHPAFRVSIKRH